MLFLKWSLKWPHGKNGRNFTGVTVKNEFIRGSACEIERKGGIKFALCFETYVCRLVMLCFKKFVFCYYSRENKSPSLKYNHIGISPINNDH